MTEPSATLSDLVRGHPKREIPKEEDPQAERDQFLADRGELARKLVASEYWTDLLLPAIEMLYDQYLTKAKAGNLECMGGVKFADDLVTIIGGCEKLGRRAIHRIAERAFGKDNVLPFQEKQRV